MKNLLGENIDYVLCGYLAELVCCNANCNECNEDDKTINREVFKSKYGDDREILFSKKNTRKKSKI